MGKAEKITNLDHQDIKVKKSLKQQRARYSRRQAKIDPENAPRNIKESVEGYSD